MKILLLRPNSVIPVASPPIGLMYLVGYLRKYRSNKDEVKIHDARGELTSDDGVGEIIREYQPDLVGVTSFTMEAKTAHKYIALAKQYVPDCITVLGGPYGTSESDIALKDQNIDYTIRGEGEQTLVNLLESLDNGKEVAGVKGISYRKNGKIEIGEFPDLIQDLDDIPFPAWDTIDLERYFVRDGLRRLMNPIQVRLRGMSLFSTRGCPYRCTYCHNVFGKKLRKRSVENVLGEIKWLVEDFKVDEIEFIDDVWNCDRNWAKAICDGIVEAGWDLRMSFPNGLRADQMDEELVDKMKAAGAYRICYAVESATPRIQKMIKKNVNLERTMEIINYTADQGISTGGAFMLGFRDETEEEAWNTIKYAFATKLHTASFFILTPFPNTPMYDEALSMGYDMSAMYSDYSSVSANLSKIENKRLEQLRRIAYRRFFFNPRRALAIIRTTPSKRTLFRNFFRAVRIAITGKELKSADL